MNLLVWNVEWAAPRSKRGAAIQGIIADLQPDVICMTEGTASMLPGAGHTIEASPDYGYGATGERRKVLLWSRSPWIDVDRVGDSEMPGGRFIAGTTGGLRFVGVCIPWRDAHVRTGRKDREPWQDHLAYLAGLRRALEATDGPAVVAGDFNQRLPRRRQPTAVHEALTGAMGSSWKIISAGVVDDDGADLIDHVAVSPELDGRVTGSIPRATPDGVRLSDHPGVLVEIRVGSGSKES